jgi:hypothetical protein
MDMAVSGQVSAEKKQLLDSMCDLHKKVLLARRYNELLPAEVLDQISASVGLAEELGFGSYNGAVKLNEPDEPLYLVWPRRLIRNLKSAYE